MAIITRNGIHGGVETMIALQQRALKADVLVAGGEDFPDTCPFSYARVACPKELRQLLQGYDVLLYHWPPAWAVDCISHSGIPSAEFIHREDTAHCDKSVPQELLTHSEFLAGYVQTTWNRPCRVLPHPIDLTLYQPAPLGSFIGGPTSYYLTKGLDVLLRAWKVLGDEFPNRSLRFYGLGTQLPEFQDLSNTLGTAAEFLPPNPQPHSLYREFGCIVLPSRLEGLPFVALEALAANVPVIASDLAGMREFNAVAVYRGFAPPLTLFKTEDPEDLARTLREVLARLERTDTRAYIEKFHSLEKHGDLLVKALRAATEKPLPPPADLRYLGRWSSQNLRAAQTCRDGFYFMDALLMERSFCEALSDVGETIASFDLFPSFGVRLPAGTDGLEWFVRSDRKVGGTWQVDWIDEKFNILSRIIDGCSIHANELTGGQALQIPEAAMRALVTLRPHDGQTFRVLEMGVDAICQVPPESRPRSGGGRRCSVSPRV